MKFCFERLFTPNGFRSIFCNIILFTPFSDEVFDVCFKWSLHFEFFSKSFWILNFLVKNKIFNSVLAYFTVILRHLDYFPLISTHVSSFFQRIKPPFFLLEIIFPGHHSFNFFFITYTRDMKGFESKDQEYPKKVILLTVFHCGSCYCGDPVSISKHFSFCQLSIKYYFTKKLKICARNLSKSHKCCHLNNANIRIADTIFRQPSILFRCFHA